MKCSLRVAATVAAIACICGSACDRRPPRATVAGMVKYDGEPIPYGDIVFQPTSGWDGFYCQGKIIDGKYSIPEHGPVVGPNRVEIHGFRQTEQLVPDVSGRKLDEKPAMARGLIPYVPAKYNDTSELTITIAPGENNPVDFDLAK